MDPYQYSQTLGSTGGGRAIGMATAGIADPYQRIGTDYPVESVRPYIPPHLRAQVTEETLELKNEEALLMGRQAANIINDIKLNEQIARYYQMPKAREAMAELDPYSPDFLQDAIRIQNQFPIAFEDSSFYNATLGNLINRHQAIMRSQDISGRRGAAGTATPGGMTNEEFVKLIEQRDAILDAAGAGSLDELREKGDGPRAFAVEEINRKIEEYMGGMRSTPTMSAPAAPIPAGSPSPAVTPSPAQQGSAVDRAMEYF